MRHRQFFIYVLARDSGVLYTGVTSDLRRRVYQHKSGLTGGLTRRYRVHKLVWWEGAEEPRAAIAREKQVKAWNRKKRVSLITEANPGWQDLAADWFR